MLNMGIMEMVNKMIDFRKRCGTMDQFRNYGSKYKYTLTVDGKRIPIIWKEI
jgi:hypothetical protein